jgi:dienelactone hydrolase
MLVASGPDSGLISDFKMTDTIPGSGPYAPAGIFTDPSLPGHTIYVPRTVPTGVKLPVIVWGNGGCMNSGDMFQLFLTEVASHGYLVIASGSPTMGDVAGGKSVIDTVANIYSNGLFTTTYQMTQSEDWVMRGGADGFAEIEKDKIASAGQSCGGLEAFVAAMHDERIKAVGLFNSGLILKSTRCLLKQLKVPVGYFLGGEKDIANRNVCPPSLMKIFGADTLTRARVIIKISQMD